MAEELVGLGPRIAADCRVLVLGSMPGGASLQAGQYYAHPRNRFWPLMQHLFGIPAGHEYERRIVGLQRAGVGLWDVIGRCRRRGSLDSAIERGSELPNAVAEILQEQTGIAVVALNGGKAASAFRRYVVPQLQPQRLQTLTVLPLPSTSPAHAAMDLPALVRAWSVLAAADA
ncbi:DNA-deoxyinosine glycosylase [Pseudoxanthomonas kalamensis DSM 18571]|uniref:DNA-deoxyinosine glycosylase n=1 Tax=Pseudoxanthomonas kalamensis TaxID=289483 RepID=UPI001391F6D7|nr:DNA-deoxyinosine glycosylase [Pseudoxanthomonas kalamensis]KAF1712572.1 DNA-deoxyinosine glycosylase [Pseudoxanthomonas kalamensis DSM 18571]